MKVKLTLLLAVAGVWLIGACKYKTTTAVSTDTTTIKEDTNNIVNVKPKGPKPNWAHDIKPQMQAVIEKLESYSDKPVTQLTVIQARKNHTVADAAMDVMKDNHIPAPVFNVDTVGKDIPVNAGTIHIRIYTPKTGTGPFPVIVYYHGGGFVLGSIDAYNTSATLLADKVGAVVISAAYRLAPGRKFPVAHNDAYYAYEWATKNAKSINGNPKKIAVAGESAGGNLAVVTAIKARDKHIMMPIAILAIYPIAGADVTTDSYTKYANAEPLNKPMMMWFFKRYLLNMSQASDPRIDLISAKLKGLPPTTIITAELDPLHDDGVELAAKLRDEGVAVESKNYDGVTHEFFGMGAVVPEAKQAEMYAVSSLRKAFGK